MTAPTTYSRTTLPTQRAALSSMANRIRQAYAPGWGSCEVVGLVSRGRRTWAMFLTTTTRSGAQRLWSWELTTGQRGDWHSHSDGPTNRGHVDTRKGTCPKSLAKFARKGWTGHLEALKAERAAREAKVREEKLGKVKVGIVRPTVSPLSPSEAKLQEIAEAADSFPRRFQLRGVEGTFRISREASYHNQSGVVIVTQQLSAAGVWEDAYTGSPAQLRARIKPETTPEPETTPQLAPALIRTSFVETTPRVLVFVVEAGDREASRQRAESLAFYLRTADLPALTVGVRHRPETGGAKVQVQAETEELRKSVRKAVIQYIETVNLDSSPTPTPAGHVRRTFETAPGHTPWLTYIHQINARCAELDMAPMFGQPCAQGGTWEAGTYFEIYPTGAVLRSHRGGTCTVSHPEVEGADELESAGGAILQAETPPSPELRLVRGKPASSHASWEACLEDARDLEGTPYDRGLSRKVEALEILESQADAGECSCCAPEPETTPEPSRCPSCCSAATWVPTYCNHGHCASCFDPLDPDHECSWSGEEHPSLGKSRDLPGNVYSRPEPTPEPELEPLELREPSSPGGSPWNSVTPTTGGHVATWLTVALQGPEDQLEALSCALASEGYESTVGDQEGHTVLLVSLEGHGMGVDHPRGFVLGFARGWGFGRLPESSWERSRSS